MSRKKPRKSRARGGTQIKRGTRFWMVAVIATIGVMVAAAFVFFSGEKTKEDAKQEKVRSSAPAPAQETQSDLNKLVGRWLRPDGGYIIEIRSISANGNLDAGYFNPRPINVSRAEASRRGDEVRVFMELQDMGYPGSTYTLTYDPPRDVLRGVYFHAGLSQTFDVVFVRTQ